MFLSDCFVDFVLFHSGFNSGFAWILQWFFCDFGAFLALQTKSFFVLFDRVFVNVW